MYFKSYSSDINYYFYLQMLLVRRIEEKIGALFSEGKVRGTTHLYIGQEANAAAFGNILDQSKDVVFSNHRCHGHYLCFGGAIEGLLGEIMGKSCGVCKGAGGSQHLKTSNFFSSGIQGGLTSIACGAGMAEKLKGDNSVVLCWIGDGTLGQGVVYESLNLASLWDIPVLFLVENNGIAQTTEVSKGVAGSIKERGAAFGLFSSEISSTDILEIHSWGKSLVEYVRNEQKPAWGIINTLRLCSHSKGDDTRKKEEIESLFKSDPLAVHGNRIDENQKKEADFIVSQELEKSFLYTENSSELLSLMEINK
ncbi:MAG: thiamine pyrophosphate-dependent dehydrogenase E1 component subunit alpha [Candidatus Muiribacteriota bacterium]